VCPSLSPNVLHISPSSRPTNNPLKIFRGNTECLTIWELHFPGPPPHQTHNLHHNHTLNHIPIKLLYIYIIIGKDFYWNPYPHTNTVSNHVKILKKPKNSKRRNKPK
jgi:hypothetical protein